MSAVGKTVKGEKATGITELTGTGAHTFLCQLFNLLCNYIVG